MTGVEVVPSDKGLAWIRFGTPDRPTVLSHTLIQELTAVVHQTASDPAIRVLVLEGQPGWFCVGADLGVYTTGTDRDAREYLGCLTSLFRAIWESPTVVVAAMSGLVLGGGSELALWCDLRVCSDDVSIGFPETGIGAIPGAGGVQILSRLVGLSVANQMVLTGERMSGPRAAELGLVHACVPASDLNDRLRSLVDRIAGLSPVGLGSAKRMLHASLDASLDASLAMGLEAMHLAMFLGDAVEGISAFFQRRAPDFDADRGTALFAASQLRREEAVP
ncbi:MAG: enoyl-CoA hydratase/isomerase family protein [Actinomycetota bacterium]